MSNHITAPILDETGYAVLRPSEQRVDAAEWLDLEYTPWRSSGITRFAPLASYAGEIECNAFWNHTPPRPDKDGVWVPEQVAKAPTLTAAAAEPGANIGRCRVIELRPNTYADAIYNLHRDDNNRLNPPGTGWIVRGMLNLTDDTDSVFILREDRFDPATEVRIPLPAGTRLIVDTERLWHAVWHRGEKPRYCLITSWESGAELQAYAEANGASPRSPSAPIDPETATAAEEEVRRRLEERRRVFSAQGIVEPFSGLDGPADAMDVGARP
ncbi:hypothetical protein [Microbacterium sp.]|uniref:hypothetical protein n=1 Tax=Microbacterium sp. TaxID=51671 RepID=UPI0037CB992A